MRHQLAALNGQQVLVGGRWTEHRKRGDYAHLLLNKVDVYKLGDNDTAYTNETPVCHIDHLWCTEPGAENTPGRELYTRMYFVGVVKPYQRANGTKDYGIIAEPWEDLDYYLLNQVSERQLQILNQFASVKAKASAHISLYQSAIAFIENSKRHLIGIKTSPNEWLAFYKKLLDKSLIKYHRVIKKEKKEAKRIMRKRVSSHSDQPARGFG